MGFGFSSLLGGSSGGGGLGGLLGGASGGGGLGGLLGGSSGGGGGSMPDIGKMLGLKIDPMHMCSQVGLKCIPKALGGKTGQTVLPIVGQAIGSIWGPMGGEIGKMAGQQAASDAKDEKANLASKEAKRNSIWT